MTRGMVISKEIDERKMDYRGSKSKEGIPFVKEQRADASSYGIKKNDICKVCSSHRETGS
jgi:hypothetical protein